MPLRVKPELPGSDRSAACWREWLRGFSDAVRMGASGRDALAAADRAEDLLIRSIAHRLQTTKLVTVLREKAEEIENLNLETRLDTAELIRVLARMVEGKDVYRAFGAPGDWGYGTPIGDALMEAYA